MVGVETLGVWGWWVLKRWCVGRVGVETLGVWGGWVLKRWVYRVCGC